MSSASKQFFDTLSGYPDLEALIAGGETEGLYLECKAPTTPQLNKDLRSTLAKAISGFGNSAGGVLIWGVSTTKHQHGGLDVLSQIEPIGNCKNFMQQIMKSCITLTTPRIQNIESKVILEKSGATRGIVLTHIPETLGDPVRSNEDGHFYFRSSDEFVLAPYEIIKRLFSATSSPDLSVIFDSRLVKNEEDGTWLVPLTLENRSSAIAENIAICVYINNAEACESYSLPEFKDASHVNPGEKIFIQEFENVVHRGMNNVIGRLHVKMKKQKRSKRILKIKVLLYANRMRARYFTATISLAKKGFAVSNVVNDFLY